MFERNEKLMLYNFFKYLKKITVNFDANDIFYSKRCHGYCWEKYYESKVYTKLGQWFEDVPNIFQILKLPYYILASIWWFIGNLIYQFLSLFFPKSWGL
jgi:hypothetical protein